MRRGISSCGGGPVAGAVMAVGIVFTLSLMALANERADQQATTRHLSDRFPFEHSAERGRMETASFRMTDHGLKSAYPRAPGMLLSELVDAAVPVSPDQQPLDVSRALPPLDVHPSTIESPEEGAAGLGQPCPACEACNRFEVAGPCCDARERDTCATGIRQRRAGTLGASSRVGCWGWRGWFQDAQVFLAGDGWKNNFDDDRNNNFGLRTGFNLGVPFPGDQAVRGQIGMSYGAYDFHGREQPLQSLLPDLRLSRDDPIEQQVFATAGLFKRSRVSVADPLAWGAVYDVMMSRSAGDAADSLKLAQLRGYVGFALNDRNEIGSWMSWRLMRDEAIRNTLTPGVTERVLVNVTDQANLFWRHQWARGGDTMAYVGWADDPGDVVVGLNGRVPLNHHAALFGNFHYVIPSTTGGDNHPTIGTDDIFTQEAWNVSFGIVLYGGRRAVFQDISGPAGLPLLPVADNASFSFQGEL